MQCPTHAYADVLVATANGRIDFAGAQVLEGALAPALAPDGPVRGIVIDLAGVDYISSVGLRVLMVAAKAMRARKAPSANGERQMLPRQTTSSFTAGRWPAGPRHALGLRAYPRPAGTAQA